MIALVLMLAAAIGGLPRVYTPDTSVEGYTKVPPPNIRMRMNEASATTVPWIDSNASRYMRGVKKAFYAKSARRFRPPGCRGGVCLGSRCHPGTRA